MGAEQPSFMAMIMPFVFMIPIFYFLVIRPQSQRAKQQDQFLNALKRGDEVITTSGILGRIEGITDRVVTLELSQGVSVKILKRQIAGSQQALLKETAETQAVKK